MYRSNSVACICHPTNESKTMKILGIFFVNIYFVCLFFFFSNRRLYCSNCLTRLRDRPLCERCVIFNKRPLSKIELLKLKAKDLIFYLQSKHISTTGCVGELYLDFVCCQQLLLADC